MSFTFVALLLADYDGNGEHYNNIKILSDASYKPKYPKWTSYDKKYLCKL